MITLINLQNTIIQQNLKANHDIIIKSEVLNRRLASSHRTTTKVHTIMGTVSTQVAKVRPIRSTGFRRGQRHIALFTHPLTEQLQIASNGVCEIPNSSTFLYYTFLYQRSNNHVLILTASIHAFRLIFF